MNRSRPARAVLQAAAFALLFAPALSFAQAAQNRDSREVSAYVLTEAGLAKYSRATANLGNLAKQVGASCDDDNAKSLDESVARINATPGAQAAIQSAGMTTREYLVFSLSLFQNGMAAWALSQPGGKLPPGANKANVDFVNSHEQALQKLNTSKGSDDCDDRDDRDDEQPDE